MEVLSIKGTSQYPEVLLDKKKGLLSFSGNSLPEDAKGFFEPIMAWIDDYIKEWLGGETTLSFKMTYYNTPSSKLIFQIFKKFEKVHKEGAKVKVVWYSPEDDPDMRDAGLDYSENVKLPFEYISYKE